MLVGRGNRDGRPELRSCTRPRIQWQTWNSEQRLPLLTRLTDDALQWIGDLPKPLRRLETGCGLVTFEINRSELALPALDPEPLDLVLIDGSHAFPHVFVDWMYTAPGSRSAAAWWSTTSTCGRGGAP
jgi:hypothetical protein